MRSFFRRSHRSSRGHDQLWQKGRRRQATRAAFFAVAECMEDRTLLTTFNVANTSDFLTALAAVDIGGANSAPNQIHQINVTGNIALTQQLWAVNLSSGSTLSINGGGKTLDGGNTYNGLFVYNGTVSISNLTITNAKARGGAGGAGAGGGAGLGGGVFVASGGNVTLNAVTFTNNAAQGGAGTTGNPDYNAGGGGLNGGKGGDGFGLGNSGGGGGIGFSATGGSAGTPPGAGIILGVPATSGTAANGGGGNGPNDVQTAGSGGGVGAEIISTIAPGGRGGFGGGGGSATGNGAFVGNAGPGGFGGGGGMARVGAGTSGGFGGGGSMGSYFTDFDIGGPGGSGGFGGGSGQSVSQTLSSNNSGTGGGGLGAGGDVFVQQGGTLNIIGGTLGAASVTGGTGFTNGLGLGDGIFIQGNQSITLGATSGQTLAVQGVIADQTGSGGTGGNAGAGALLIDNNPGVVQLTKSNTYTGGTTLNSGTFALAPGASAGTGPVTFGSGKTATLRFAGSTGLTNTVKGFGSDDTIGVANVGLATGYSLGANNVLTLTGGTVSPVTLNLDPAQSFTGKVFVLTSDGNGGTNITLANASSTTISGTGQTDITDKQTTNPFANITLTDTNPAPTETLVITWNNANGILSYQSVPLISPVTVSSSTSTAQAILRSLVFTPTANQLTPGQAATTTFTITDTNGAGLMSSDTNAKVVTTSVNDSPAISGTVAGQTVDDNKTIKPFATAKVTDPDVAAAVSLGITFPAANGTLSGTGLSGGSGSYTLAATDPATLTAELAALVFTPTAHQVAPGLTVTTTFAITASDGLGGTAGNSITSVIATATETPSLVVNTTSDNSTSTDGLTSLREAVLYANSLGGKQTVTFAPALTSGGAASIVLSGGVISITSSLTLAGPGADKLTIDGNQNTRFITVNDGNGTRQQDVTISGLTLTNGRGAVYNRENLTLTGNVLSANSASPVVNEVPGRLVSSSNAYVNNIAPGSSGGGIYNQSTLQSSNDTFSGNRAFDGGAIYNNSGTVSLTNDTVTNNIAVDLQSGRGGGVASYNGMLTLANTLVAGNTAAAGGADLYIAQDDGSITSLGHNLIGDGDGVGEFVASDLVGTTASPINPQLAALANNGGTTPTHALLAGSPAIGAGVSIDGITTDQRGVTRHSTPDIGAYEASRQSLVVTTLADEDNGNADPLFGTGTSLREAINYANAHAGADEITFDPTVFGTTPRTIQLGGTQLELTGTDKTTITGPGESMLTVDAKGLSRVFSITSPVDLSGMTITGGRIAEGQARGGGIYASIANDAVPLRLSHLHVTGNVAQGDGSGGSFYASGQGGGMYLEGGTLTLTDSTIDHNSAVEGNAFISSAEGGGLYRGRPSGVNNAPVTVDRVTFAYNTTSGEDRSGGGLFLEGEGHIQNSTFVGNESGEGGGVYVLRNASFTNVTVAGNSGGGIQFTFYSATLRNALVVGNNGPGVASYESEFTAETSFIAGNTGQDIESLITPGVGTQIGFPAGITSIGQVIAVNADNKPLLADNGGPTATIALVRTSPAVGAGSNTSVPDGVTTDQRGAGFPRIFGKKVDIGAFELQALVSSLTVVDAGGVYNGSPFPAAATVVADGDVVLSLSPAVNYYLATDTTFSSPLAGAPSDAGSYVARATFDGSGIYTAATPITTPFQITLATPSISVIVVGGSYSGSAFVASGTVTGVNNADLGPASISYFLASDALRQNPLLAAPTNVGQYVAVGSYAGSANYASGSAEKAFAITQVSPAVSVNPISLELGQALANSQLSGTATATLNGVPTIVPGLFTFTTAAGTIPPAGAGQSFAVTFTPTDSVNFTSVATTVTVDVSQSTVSIGDVRKLEGNSGTTLFQFPVTRASSKGIAAVDFATVDDSANSVDDYSYAAGSVVFADGELTKYVTVGVKGDLNFEPDQKFNVVLSNPTNLVIAKGTGVGTILNDDGPVGMSIDDVAVVEGNSGTRNLVFTVRLSAGSHPVTTVKYTTVGGTATSGTDFTAKSGTLTFGTFQQTQMIVIPIKGDTATENDETFKIVLSNVTGGARLVDDMGVGTILNDDVPPPPPLPKLSIADVSVAEGTGSGFTLMTFTVKLDKAATGGVSVKYNTANGTANSAGDYTATSGTVTFAAGQLSKTFTVQIKKDAVKEADETLFINLTNLTGAATYANTQAKGTIRNDD